MKKTIMEELEEIIEKTQALKKQMAEIGWLKPEDLTAEPQVELDERGNDE